jgi:hypothetical protein
VPETEALLGLQKQVAELEEAQQQLNADLHDSREMLVEAANAYALKEEEVSSLSCDIVSLRQALAEQVIIVDVLQCLCRYIVRSKFLNVCFEKFHWIAC